jgi:hypothetical protein
MDPGGKCGHDQVMGPRLLVEPGKATFFQLWLPLHTLLERFSELRLPERLNGVALVAKAAKQLSKLVLERCQTAP